MEEFRVFLIYFFALTFIARSS